VRRGRWRLRAACLLSLASLAATASPARAQPFPANEQRCLTPFETDAFNLRLLQSYLMVNALSCNRPEDYNLFVRRHANSLSQSYRLMQGHFRRHDGDGAQRALDSFITWAANRHARSGNDLGAAYCPGSVAIWERIRAATDAAQVVAIAEEINLPDHAAFPPPC
jgi:hypothetical protein